MKQLSDADVSSAPSNGGAFGKSSVQLSSCAIVRVSFAGTEMFTNEAIATSHRALRLI